MLVGPVWHAFGSGSGQAPVPVCTPAWRRHSERLQVMLVRVGVDAVLHDTVTLARHISPHGKLMEKDELAAILGLPSKDELCSMTMTGTLRTNTMRPKTAYSKQLAQVWMLLCTCCVVHRNLDFFLLSPGEGGPGRHEAWMHWSMLELLWQ